MQAELSTFPGPMIRARALAGFARLAARHGGDAAALLSAAGMAPTVLASPEAPLPLSRMMTLLDTAAHRLAVPDFGLRLAQLQDIRVLGPVAMIARHAATVGAACAGIARHLPYHSPGVRLHVEDDPERRGYSQFRFDLGAGAALPQRQMMELYSGVAARILRGATRETGADWHMHYRHAACANPARYRACFPGAVHFGQARDSLSFPTPLLALAIAPGGVVLRQAAERWVGNAIRRDPLDLCRQVEALVVRHLMSGGATLIHIASQLGLHERTLQRRLRGQGLQFEDMVDTVRRRLAAEYLSSRAIPLAEVSAILGYSEQSSLNRACKRWFDATPHAYREGRLA